ncbi:hypothetical protein WP12_09015 [Sphingomonas sp. SRS2]|nr:hypothetical protein WP12_09015 [Sphingomonas sp. SRS2]
MHPGYRSGFILVVSLFFIWAIANNFNDILIRQFQKALALDRAEAGLIQFVYYIGYFTMALPAGFVMRRFGYRAGIITGLLLYASGALLFWPAAEVRLYLPFLAALYIIACGAAFLETAANPYVVAFGDPRRASQRLNFAHAFNGLGSVLAPALGGIFIFSGVEHGHEALSSMSPAQLDAFRAAEAGMVQMPYLILAIVVALVALAVAFVPLPAVDTSGGAADSDGKRPGLAGLLRERGLTRAVVAQFFYIGAQVSLWSFFVDYVKETAPAFSEKQAAFLLSGSLVLFMLGRFGGAALMTRHSPARMLSIAAASSIALCALATVLPGYASVAALTLTGLTTAIIFPTIFSLGVRDLGPRASLGASLLIMAIVGGAVLPPLMGLLSQTGLGLRGSLIVPAVSFAIIALYGWRQARRDATAG